MKDLYQAELSSKQAHAQYQNKEQFDAFEEQEILNKIALLRIKHPVMGLTLS